MNGGSEEGEESSENVEAAFEHWDAQEREEIKELKEFLMKASNNNNELVDGKHVKRKLAYFCLKVIDRTSHNKQDIRETAYILAGFNLFKFGDKLDEAFSLSGELELPELHISGDIFQNWKKLRSVFDEYVK